MAQTETVTFKFSGKMARLLGEESVSSPTVAISELVKNAYDADAKHCSISFEGIGKDQILRIKDTGDGMTYTDLINKWMVIGTSDKEYNPLTASGRIKVGEKGIGRFAVQRLGHFVELISHPVNEESEIYLAIDWDKYAAPEVTFDKVEHQVQIRKRTDLDDKGLEMIIKRLRDVWDKPQIEDLQRALGTLVPPTWDEKKFQITLSAPLFGIQEETLEPAVFQNFLYHLKIRYDGASAAKGTLEFLKDGETLEKREVSFEPGKLSCGPVQFELYTYVLSSGRESRYSPWVLKGDKLRKQLKTYHGIRIFRDGFRVRPYGDPGNDWLSLSSQARNELYAFPNDNVIGMITISKTTNPLVDTTTREGLIQSNAFFDLQDFLRKAIGLVILHRRKDFPEQPREKIVNTEAMTQIERVGNTLRSRVGDQELSRNFDKALVTLQKEVADFQEKEITKIGMYRGLASLGISLGAIAHEIAEPIGSILQRAKRALEVLAKRPFTFQENLTSWRQVSKDIQKVNEFVGFVSVFTSAPERTQTMIELGPLIEDVFHGYKSIFENERVETILRIERYIPQILGFRVDMETILINLITNSIEALREIQDRKRVVKVTCERRAESISIKFSDSGPGIPPVNRELIFEPFWTTKAKEGTGLGLTIVKEILLEYGGSIMASKSELDSGATFLISLPLPPGV